MPLSFVLTLTFDHDQDDPLYPGCDAGEAFQGFRSELRGCCVAMACALDPRFQVLDGEASDEDQHPQGSSGIDRFGTEEGGLVWDWGEIAHCADETMSGEWRAVGLGEGVGVSCSIRRRRAGIYAFAITGSPRRVQAAASVLATGSADFLEFAGGVPASVARVFPRRSDSGCV